MFPLSPYCLCFLYEYVFLHGNKNDLTAFKTPDCSLGPGFCTACTCCVLVLLQVFALGSSELGLVFGYCFLISSPILESKNVGTVKHSLDPYLTGEVTKACTNYLPKR